MKETFIELINYLKNPVLAKDENTDGKYRMKKFLYLFLICIVTSFAIIPLLSLIENTGLIDASQHSSEILMKNNPGLFIMIGIIVAPIIEEIIFRGPLTLFYNPKYFKNSFFIFTILFGFIHILNFELTTNALLLSPILVLPQTILGGYLGFIRVKFGLAWSILLHATYNAFFILISFGSDLF
ncbi:CPBP family intramembrane glutamic endopeptidase [Tenacibaculum sp. MEBiC06402]|uniref:CPBP family intramembrane glutamic endopeptidase n=1 Tax=unclassified Tenacibaculum TaxID=2635139 RepID=UPI003B9D4CF6